MRIALTLVLSLFVGNSVEAKTSGWKSADDVPQATAPIQVTSHTTLVPRRHTVYQANSAAANSGFNTQQLQQGFQAADQWVQTAAAQPQTTIGGEIYKGVDSLAKGTTQVLQNAGEAIQGTGQNLAQTVERGLGLNQPAQPPAPAGSGRYNQWSYNYPNPQQPAATTTATASQWTNPPAQSQSPAQSQWPATTAATQPPVSPQPTAAANPSTWTNTGWGGAQPTSVATQSNNGWNNATPAMPAAQTQPSGGLTAPSFNDSQWARNDSVLVPRGGTTQPSAPSLGTASGGALPPNPQSNWPSSTPANNSWSNTQPANTNPASPSETPWWQDPQWNNNTANTPQPNPQSVNTGFGDRAGADYIPPAIGSNPVMATSPGTQQVVNSPLNDSKARTAWLLLIPSFALNVYVWWSYLEIRSKYLGSLRRGGAGYTA